MIRYILDIIFDIDVDMKKTETNPSFIFAEKSKEKIKGLQADQNRTSTPGYIQPFYEESPRGILPRGQKET